MALLASSMSDDHRKIMTPEAYALLRTEFERGWIKERWFILSSPLTVKDAKIIVNSYRGKQ